MRFERFLYRLVALLVFAITINGSIHAQDLRDTTELTIRRPPASLEKDVLDDGLTYGHEKVYKDNLFSQFLRWLDDTLGKWFGNENVGYAQTTLQWLLIMLAVFIAFRIIRASGISALVTRAPKPAVFSFNDLSENIAAINFEERIRKAVEIGDYRLAIRWSYLRVLADLDGKQLIKFAPYKTNRDYQGELGARTLRDGFMTVSRIYDYVWYGEFNTGESEFRQHESHFKQFNADLSV